jgi:hypothetical protein
MKDFTDKLFQLYDDFKEKSLSHRRFKHTDIIPLIEKRKALFQISLAGKSYEGREIFLIQAGTGPKKILLWSQMHGNEPTASQAIFDVLNFLEKPGDLNIERDKILQQCSLYFIPMLNPDGAEQFIRRNSQGIDINRDALKLEAPESKILMSIRDKLNPDFGFNLHDQDVWYAVGNTKNPASISFLAPSFNYEKSTNDKRLRSKQVIVFLNKVLQQYIPEQVAKYNDDFMPTAFGDTVQMKGTSTILIESGGYFKDPEKQFIRKLNALCLLSSFKAISEGLYTKENESDYDTIPYNVKNRFFDYILRNCNVQGRKGNYSVDIGIRTIPDEHKDRYEVSDTGDLRYYSAYEEKDMQGKQVMPMKTGDDASVLVRSFFKTQ